LKIDGYFKFSQSIIDKFPNVRLSNITFEKRAAHVGYIKGELQFIDDSMLHFREYVDAENQPDRLMYAYQYVDKDGQLIFRYDNTGHHKKLQLPTYPHHKHDGREDKVISSDAPDLSSVLREIETIMPPLY
jgi:hypothetical protein